jgi:threonine dehydrogenase-like Zn-dependent dehydrogenase
MNAYIQLIPGHEAIGTIVEMGKNVKGFSIGDRCVADVGITVSHTETDFPIHNHLDRKLSTTSVRYLLLLP